MALSGAMFHPPTTAAAWTCILHRCFLPTRGRTLPALHLHYPALNANPTHIQTITIQRTDVTVPVIPYQVHLCLVDISIGKTNAQKTHF